MRYALGGNTLSGLVCEGEVLLGLVMNGQVIYQAPAAALSASFDKASVKVNIPVGWTLVVRNATSYSIYNSGGSKMGVSNVTKTDNPDGTTTYRGELQIGSAGKDRLFNFYAHDGSWQSPNVATATITVTAT